jgi:release factor glutamine methyltransferase
MNAPAIVDIGTGSGCIPIALARRLPEAWIIAGDISPAALAVARTNAKQLAPRPIDFFCGDLLTPLRGPAAIIVANLPYITDGEWTRLSDGVKYYEPSLALRGGVDGLMLVRRLLQQARTRCHPHGRLFLEIGWRQGTTVTTLAQHTFPTAVVTLHQDFAGRDRIVEIAL